MQPSKQQQLATTLRNTITDEVILAMGVSPSGLMGKALTPILRLATRRFARLVAGFDRDVGALGTRDAARNLLPQFVQGCRQSGADAIPTSGPLLVASNHPGGIDSIAILAALPRTDVRFVISDVPFLRALKNCRAHAAYASADTDERLGVVRQMVRHLRQGGTVILFPGTELDPDPAFLPGAEERLRAWSRSVALLLRRVPETRFLPTIVGGVLSPRFHRHPVAKLAPPGWERIKLAEMLQIIHQLALGRRLDIRPAVHFGTPLPLDRLVQADATTSATTVMAAITRQARKVLEEYQAQQRPTREVPIPA
jgi:hypothetical protein